MFFLVATQKKWLSITLRFIDTLTFVSTSPFLAKIFRHNFAAAKFQSSTEGDEDLLKKNRDDILGGLFLVLTRNAVVDETIICKSSKFCKSDVGIDASDFQPFSLCLPISTGLHTRRDVKQRYPKPQIQKKLAGKFENTVMSHQN